MNSKAREAKIYTCYYSGVMDKMTNLNKKSDFVLVLRAIQDGLLDNNIALYLLLDIGRFYASDCINSMRYDRETLDFWVTFWRLFKGRGINFMMGNKGEGLLLEENNHTISPSQCRINFVVPTDTTWKKEISEHRIEVEKPGMINSTLNTFASINEGVDVKLSTDEKKPSIQHMWWWWREPFGVWKIAYISRQETAI